MDKLPKRRKLKDNPYTLLIENNNYYILFKDNKNKLQKEKVEKKIFQEFNNFELEDKKILNEYSRHIEHSFQSDINIYKKTNINEKKVEDIVIDRIFKEKIRFLLNSLTETQKRRIIKYYFYDMTLDEISKEEGKSITSIKESIDSGLKKLKNLI